MDDERRQRWRITAATTGLRLKYWATDVVRLLLFVGLALGIIGVFGPFVTGVPAQITIVQAPTVVNEVSRAVSVWGAFTTPLFAFLIWQSL